MTGHDDLLTRADQWAAHSHDWPRLGMLVRDLAAALRAGDVALGTAHRRLTNLETWRRRNGELQAELETAHRRCVDLETALRFIIDKGLNENDDGVRLWACGAAEHCRALLDVPAANTATETAYAQRLADDPDVQADVERIEAALASGDEQAIKDVLGDPIDIDALRKKFDVPAVDTATQDQVWCVKHRDAWCATKDNHEPAESTTNVPTRCGHYVTLPGGYDIRTPTCPDCVPAADTDTQDE